MKKTMRSILVAGAVAVSFSVPVHAAEFINILTGGTSGVYYPLGVALSQIYGKAIPGSKTSVQATKASAENLNLLQAGRGEAAISLGDSLSDAWKGNEEAGFKSPLKKLRTIATLYPNYIHFVATADSVNMLSEACATFATVFALGGDRLGGRPRGFLERLRGLGRVRDADGELEPFATEPLRETARVADIVNERLAPSPPVRVAPPDRLTDGSSPARCWRTTACAWAYAATAAAMFWLDSCTCSARPMAWQ